VKIKWIFVVQDGQILGEVSSDTLVFEKAIAKLSLFFCQKFTLVREYHVLNFIPLHNFLKKFNNKRQQNLASR